VKHIKLFEQYLEEKKDNNESDLGKVYVSVNTETGHEAFRNEGSDAFQHIGQDNVDTIKLDPNIPILNYNKILTKKIAKKFPKNFIYNPNEEVKKSGSKKLFHEIVGESPNIPKTVYNEKDALKIGFPIIAKPSEGHSGVGIQIFKNKDDFDKADQSKFDVYSQYIDKKSENRVINFKGKPFAWLERQPINDKAKNGDGKADSEMVFEYTKKDPSKLPDNFAKVNKAFCKKFPTLSLLCFDFMEDQDGKVYVIEANTMTGVPFDITIDMYKLIFNDFYKRPVNAKTEAELGVLSKKLIKRTMDRSKGDKFDTQWKLDS